MNLRQLLDYEIRASWWAEYVGAGWLQDLAGSYFAWKVTRKHARWEASRLRAARLMEFVSMGSPDCASPHGKSADLVKWEQAPSYIYLSGEEGYIPPQSETKL